MWCGEHARDLRNKLPGSNLYQHVLDQHSGDVSTEFKYEVSGVFQKDVLSRQLEEGMRIESHSGITPVSYTHLTLPTTPYV